MSNSLEYPQIDRKDGRLFFTCAENDRVAIATSIERLIDMLDALEPDPDLEDGDDDEHSLGWPNTGTRSSNTDDLELDDSDSEPGTWFENNLARESWRMDNRHEDDEDGHDDEPSLDSGCAPVHNGELSYDLEDDHADSEPDLGWTNHIDQTIAPIVHADGDYGHNETDLGWTDNGRGWQQGEPLLEGEEEREADPAECGIADADGMIELGLYGGPSAMVLKYDGSGTNSAVAMLRAAGLTMLDAEAYSPVSEPGTLFLRITQ